MNFHDMCQAFDTSRNDFTALETAVFCSFLSASLFTPQELLVSSPCIQFGLLEGIVVGITRYAISSHPLLSLSNMH